MISSSLRLFRSLLQRKLPPNSRRFSPRIELSLKRILPPCVYVKHRKFVHGEPPDEKKDPACMLDEIGKDTYSCRVLIWQKRKPGGPNRCPVKTNSCRTSTSLTARRPWLSTTMFLAA